METKPAQISIFDLKVTKPSNLHEEVIEADEGIELVLDKEKESSSLVEGVWGEPIRVTKLLGKEALKPLLKGCLIRDSVA